MTPHENKADRPSLTDVVIDRSEQPCSATDPGGVTAEHATPASGDKKGWRGRLAVKTGRRAFWVWIAYQSIKGTLTLLLIWIPIFLFWIAS